MRTIKVIFLISILFTSLTSNCQEDIDKLLDLIEKNNLGIISLNAQMEFEKANSRSELLPSNPSFEFGRFPSAIGDGVKYAWGVSQHIEFPTVYSKRIAAAKSSDVLHEYRYRISRQEIILEAKLLIIEILFTQKMLSIFREREEYAKRMVDDFQKRLNVGDVSIIDVNNAGLRLLDFSLQVKETESKLRGLNQKLIVANGEKPLEIPVIDLPYPLLPDKDSLLNIVIQLDPRLLYTESMVKVAEDELSLTKHMGLPELEIGFASEKTETEHFAGFKAGLSIPLWGNVNKTKSAKQNLNAVKLEKARLNSEVISHYENLFIEAQSFNERINELRNALESKSNLFASTKSFETGQISSFELFQEMQYYFDLYDKMLYYELEYFKVVTTLNGFSL